MIAQKVTNTKQVRFGSPFAVPLFGASERCPQPPPVPTEAMSEDRPGFVANRILMPYINEAFFVLGEGVASAEDIDKTMKLGTSVPMGRLPRGVIFFHLSLRISLLFLCV